MKFDKLVWCNRYLKTTPTIIIFGWEIALISPIKLYRLIRDKDKALIDYAWFFILKDNLITKELKY